MSASQLPTAHPSGTEQRPLVLERYRLGRRLGVGAFGTVWMAHDKRLERDVAIKIVPSERVLSGRFEREARAAARLLHPGIVTLYEAAFDDDGAYLVSELVRGATLDQLLEAGRLSDRDIVRIAIVLCDALAHAHAHGIVHRDVKPSNVLIPDRPVTPSQLAKLTDFGVARMIGGRSLTRTGDVVGTAAYMAPEQAEGLMAGEPADVYSLALVTYEALTGINPVSTGTAAQRARRLGAYLPPLRRQRRELPQGLGRAVDLALRPRQGERGTLLELRAALVAALPQLKDAPGVVVSPWPARTRRPETTDGDVTWSVSPEPPDGPTDRDRYDRVAERPRIPLARGLAGLAAAALTGWLSSNVLSHSVIAPMAAALVAAVLVAALPRVGWATVTGWLAVTAAVQQQPGAAVVIALGALLPIVLMSRSGPQWPLAAGGPALAIVGLGGAWPAVAARAGGPWRRAALGAIGWIWIVLACALSGRGLYLEALPGALRSSSASLEQVLRSGALAPAPVWALAALTLPWMVRGRTLAADGILLLAWAAATALGTAVMLGIAGRGGALLTPQAGILGALAAALIALAPRLRSGRARAQVP
jgi:hypothetical protein